MNERRRSSCLPPLFETEAQIIKCNSVGIETFAIGSVYRNKLRREIQQLPQLCLLFADFVFRPLPIFNVGEDTVPSDDVASLIPHRDATTQLPTILPISASETNVVLVGLAAGGGREPLSLVSLQIIGVNCRLPT